MRFIEYLYFKYYTFQVRVGNRDVASFSSMLIILFTIMLYYFDLLFFLILLVPAGLIRIRYLMPVSFLLFVLLFVALYFMMVRKDRYLEILKKGKNFEEKSSIGAILFPLVAFLLFNLGWVLKMLQNQGKL